MFFNKKQTQPVLSDAEINQKLLDLKRSFAADETQFKDFVAFVRQQQRYKEMQELLSFCEGKVEITTQLIGGGVGVNKTAQLTLTYDDIDLKIYDEF